MGVRQKQELDRIYSRSEYLGPSPRGHCLAGAPRAHLAALPGGMAARMSVTCGNRNVFLEKGCPSRASLSLRLCHLLPGLPHGKDGVFPRREDLQSQNKQSGICSPGSCVSTHLQLQIRPRQVLVPKKACALVAIPFPYPTGNLKTRTCF